MYELHENEQYFFDRETIDWLCNLLEQYERPCVLCAPMLGRAMHERGRRIATLDVDRRFADLPGFIEWNIHRPQRIAERFDLILCDPPFFNVSLSRLFDAIRLLADFDFTQRLMVSYLVRRASAITGTFAPFNLQPTGVRPTYQTIKKIEKNDIEWFANFDLPEVWPQ